MYMNYLEHQWCKTCYDVIFLLNKYVYSLLMKSEGLWNSCYNLPFLVILQINTCKNLHSLGQVPKSWIGFIVHLYWSYLWDFLKSSMYSSYIKWLINQSRFLNDFPIAFGIFNITGVKEYSVASPQTSSQPALTNTVKISYVGISDIIIW